MAASMSITPCFVGGVMDGQDVESSTSKSLTTGRCACSHVRYTLSSFPLMVRVCYCTYCQRETGTSFALNALYEPDRVHRTLSTGESGQEAETRLLRTGVPTETSGPEGTGHGAVSGVLQGVAEALFGRDEESAEVERVGMIDGIMDGGKYDFSGGLRPHASRFAVGERTRHEWFGIPEGDVV